MPDQKKAVVLMGGGNHVPAPPAQSSKSQASFNACINAQPVIIELNASPADPTPLVTVQDKTGQTIQAEGVLSGANIGPVVWINFKNPA